MASEEDQKVVDGSLLLKNCNLITMDADLQDIILGAHVLIKGKRIAYVGEYPPPASQVGRLGPNSLSSKLLLWVS